MNFYSVNLYSFLHPFSGQRWVRKPVGSAAMESITCLRATRRSIVHAEGQEPSFDGKRVNALRNLLGEVNLSLGSLENIDSFLKHQEEGGCFQHLSR